jgi:3-phytase
MVGVIFILSFICSCNFKEEQNANFAISPKVITEPTKHDTDDPAIWIHPDNPAQSLILGTDKNQDGALYVYDLHGKIIEKKVVRNMQRPNNVDVEYGLVLNGIQIDIAVVTERLTNKLRVFKLPDMEAVDGGGIEVFNGEDLRAPMGISLYKRPSDGAVYAVVGRKSGPREGYLWQYLLEENGSGSIKGRKVREFGAWSGKKEIEAIAVDDELGYIYYSDETIGVRKYFADPDGTNASQELALFATEGFVEDHEGISIYKSGEKTGYILVSDQQANEFHVFRREGEPGNPHQHKLIGVIKASTNESDGCEVTSVGLDKHFPDGLFVAMSDNRTFHFYSWNDIQAQLEVPVN